MIKKIVVSIILITYILLNVMINNVFAISQSTSTDINSLDSSKYPQIKEMILQLKQKHPKWNFKILYTDIEWKDAIANEYVGHGSSPKNLVPANNSKYEGDWICPVCGADKFYDNGNWHCASESAIAYMMDPRNSLNESDLFQFMELTYTECNKDTIRAMVAGTFVNNESYINAIIDSAKANNVNAYYIVARILQEQGNSGTALTSGQGYAGQYVGYYNAFNIGASGNSKDEVILNGLKKAKSQGWTTLESSINGGIKIIASSYIAKGQNTLYFQKFDVENSDGNVFWHQYMQNILAAQNEGTTLRKTFNNMGAIDSEYTFIIPVYKNMPATAANRPSTTGTPSIPTSELVKVNVNSSLRLRTSPNGSVMQERVYANEIVTRLEKATQKVGGTYWDYIMKSNGTKGYAARETYDYESEYKLYLVPVEQTNPPQPEEPEEKPQPPEEGIIQNDKVKVDSNNNLIIAIPNTTVKDIKELMKIEISAKNSKGEVLSNESKLSTGIIVNDKYTVAVLGDVNGDGEVNSGDLFFVQKYLLKQIELKECEKKSSDINKDNEINSGDLFFIQKYLLKQFDFEI